MAAELIETHRVIARTVAQIDPKWVIDAVPRLLKYSYAEPFWSKSKVVLCVIEPRVCLDWLWLRRKLLVTPRSMRMLGNY